MTEPAVTLSDYALALEGAVFLFFVRRIQGRSKEMRFWFSLYFTSASIASLCGGTVHGFFLNERSLGQAILWPTTLLAAGVTALSTWAIGAELMASRQAARWVLVAAVAQFVLYCVVVLFYMREFWVVIATNLPAVVFLLFTLAVSYWRERYRPLLVVMAALTLSLMSALLQQLKVGIHATHFDHNVLYHFLQAIVLCLLFLGGRSLIQGESSRPFGARAAFNRYT